MRTITYKVAISEALCEAMENDPSIFITGIGVDYSSAIFGTTAEALKRFGPERVFECPASENAVTGVCIGAAAMGKRPVLVHARADFSFLGMDMLINLAAKWKFMFGGNAGSVPIVVRMIIGKGWGQGATHSQALHSLYGHFPGLAVAIPGTPGAVKGILLEALRANHPTIILEHRSLYDTEGDGDLHNAPFEVSNPSPDITIASTGYLTQESVKASAALKTMGVLADVIDANWVRPFESDGIISSVTDSGHLLIADCSHELCGFSAEIAATVAEKAFHSLKGPIRRLTLPDCPAPVSAPLEAAFYPTASTIAALALEMLGKEAPAGLEGIDRPDSFKGPY